MNPAALDVLRVIYLAGCVFTAALGIVASDRLRSDWPLILAMAAVWPVLVLATVLRAR